MRPGCGSDQPSWPLPSLSQAKLGDEILDYRDLAALPKSKAIYNIDRPDMISYAPYISHSVGDRQSYSEVGGRVADRLGGLGLPCPLNNPRLLCREPQSALAPNRPTSLDGEPPWSGGRAQEALG